MIIMLISGTTHSPKYEVFPCQKEPETQVGTDFETSV